MIRFFRKNMKTIIIAVAVLFAGTMFYGGFSGLKYLKSGGAKNELTLAKVNGKEINPMKYSEILSQILSGSGRTGLLDRPYLQLVALSQAIDYTILQREAEGKVGVGGKELNSVIGQIMKSNNIPSEKVFEDILKSQGLKLSDYKNLIRSDLIVSKMIDKIKSEVEVKPEDLREIRARHILVKSSATTEAEKAKADEAAKKKAGDILEMTKKGADFAALAKKYSDDPGSAQMGGDLSYFTTGRMAKEFEDAAFALKPGEVSNVVKTQFGYHIIKLEDTRLRKAKAGEDLKAAILKEKQETSFMRWFSELKQKAKIEITNSLLNAYDLELKGNLDGALSAFNKMIAENPGNAYYHFFAGNLYERRGELPRALEEYSKAGELAQGDPEIHINTGKAYLKAKMREKSIDEFKKASMVAADYKEIHEDLKKIFNDMGEYKLAADEGSIIKRIEAKERLEKQIKTEIK
ncbi:MAG: peptidylprolyl isomerase [Candidatus Saganbacteria bacterium]|nr:peptidylprolyl isomerase [Candidatus Saganbacteria bacterium]